MGKSSGMRGNRSRNADRRLRTVRSDKHLRTIRQQYNKPVVSGRDDTHLGTIRKQTDKSETKLIKASFALGDYFSNCDDGWDEFYYKEFSLLSNSGKLPLWGEENSASGTFTTLLSMRRDQRRCGRYGQ